MKSFKAILVFLLILVNLVVVQPSFADPIAEKSPEYLGINQQLEQLLQIRNDPAQGGYTAEDLQKRIADLQFQKYIQESTEDWGVCRNETGKTIGVYAHKPSKYGTPTNTLFYLGAGKKTDDEWDCDGIYLPNDAKVAGINLPAPVAGETEQGAATQPFALKIVDGTQLVARTNPITGEVELNAPVAGVIAPGEPNWSIPNLSQAEVSAQVPNAPID
ncbi:MULTISPECIES: hypothetical protein [Nostocales]|uniref:Uncharacterized protein n=3 Tax=Nostocales TaxID=1161 RepID=A0A0C1R9Q0_9CYAN|nr:hypothetical protein [Tolypothrix bouteillei]KAF3890269.1 hypothetical protein DA73_0400036085 [Tolypothrix bouteillei VB521301]